MKTENILTVSVHVCTHMCLLKAMFLCMCVYLECLEVLKAVKIEMSYGMDLGQMGISRTDTLERGKTV